MAGPFSSRLASDQATGAIAVIDNAHVEIHEGDSYSAQYSVTTGAALGARSGLYFKTPPSTAGKTIHLIAEFAATLGSDFRILEAPTIAANTGSHANAIINRNRNSSKTSLVLDNANTPAANKFTTLTEAQIAGDGTFALGTVLRTAPVLAGSGPFAAGGVSRDTQEYVLKFDTKYILLLTTTTASATTHWILADWYEI